MDGIKKIDENVIAPQRSLTITNAGLPDNVNWQPGTLKCDVANAGLRYKVSTNTFNLFIAGNILQPNTVTSELITDGTIQTIDLADGCVTNDKIADRTIKHIKIAYHDLTNDELGNACVDERTLADDAITSDKIKDGEVKNSDIGDAAVTYDKIAANSIGSLHIMENAVMNKHIYFGAVTNDKLADKTITGAKVADKGLYGINIADKTITNINIADHTVTAANLGYGSVENVNLVDGAITSNKIATKTILGVNLADGTITSTQIADGGIRTADYADRSITREKLADNVLDVVDNAVKYDELGNVHILKENFSSCDVTIGSEDVNGKSNGNGSLRVYGDIQGDRVYNMTYADLAEGYVPGEELEPGDIVEYRQDGKVYKSSINGINAVIVGVVSDEYAQCFGASKEELESGEKVAVALIGKVHVKVNGPIAFGEKIKIGRIPGVGANWSTINKEPIGRALEATNKNGECKVLCLIRPS